MLGPCSAMCMLVNVPLLSRPSGRVGEGQAVKVLAIVIPLATLIGFAEECTFRGYLPLILAAKTGLPSAVVIGLSAVIFGVRCIDTRPLIPAAATPYFYIQPKYIAECKG